MRDTHVISFKSPAVGNLVQQKANDKYSGRMRSKARDVAITFSFSITVCKIYVYKHIH